jgi:trehalose-6-phosphate synthase
MTRPPVNDLRKRSLSVRILALLPPRIASCSRSEVPEYARLQRELAEEAGRINGKFGDVDWTPLRYINKPMSRATLAGLYRIARVGLVTPCATA